MGKKLQIDLVFSLREREKEYPNLRMKQKSKLFLFWALIIIYLTKVDIWLNWQEIKVKELYWQEMKVKALMKKKKIKVEKNVIHTLNE